ncbi:MAG: TrkA C-terminal domain-containing protein [Haloarculaceae archaeon]
MASLPVEVLLGIYLGLLVGVIPALVSWGLAFVFRYTIDITVPAFGVTVLAVALAGVNGGLLALADKTVTQNPDAPRLVTAIIVVAMLAMYAHQKGDTMGAEFPHRFTLSGLRTRTLSAELADIVGGNEVRVRVVGDVDDMEGYPPLPEDLRAELRAIEWRFPADLRLDELETRVSDRLRTEFDLSDVSVSVDERGRATVSAAPPFSGLSRRVTEGRQAVSVAGLLPTGLARGDEVTVVTPDAEVQGTVVSARTDSAGAKTPSVSQPTLSPESPDADGDGDDRPAPVRAPTTDGGEGRLTVAVPRSDVRTLLGVDRAKVVVESKGTRREYEAVSLLRRAGRRIRRLTVGAGSVLADGSLGTARVREEYGATVLAVRTPDGWQFAPGGGTTLDPDDELFAVGEREALEALGEALSGTRTGPEPGGGDD